MYTCCALAQMQNVRKHDCDRYHIYYVRREVAKRYIEYMKGGATEWDRTLDFDKIPEWLIQAGLEAVVDVPSMYESCCGSPKKKKKDPLLLERQRRLSNAFMGE